VFLICCPTDLLRHIIVTKGERDFPFGENLVAAHGVVIMRRNEVIMGRKTGNFSSAGTGYRPTSLTPLNF
jgi:hypothetical protein